jgi:hypothetical protein
MHGEHKKGKFTMENFRKELESLINRHSMENGSDTPDFILAEYLTRCLENFDATTKRRDGWYGNKPLIDKILSGELSPNSNLPKADVVADVVRHAYRGNEGKCIHCGNRQYDYEFHYELQ